MKKRFAILLVLCLMTGSLSALAELGAVDVTMDGAPYHLVLDSVDLVNGKLTVVMEGFGDTLSMGPRGAMMAGTPVAWYGDEAVTYNNVSIVVGAPFTFTFERDSLPDAIWVQPYDSAASPVLLWQAEGKAAAQPPAGAPTAEPTEAPTEEPTAAPTEAPTAAPAEAAWTEPVVPTLDVPDIDVPDIPKAGEEDTTIEVPEIPAVQIPAMQAPLLFSAEPGDDQAGESGGAEPQEAPAEEEAPAAHREVSPDEVLAALGEDLYRDTYAALKDGEVIEKGSKGDVARGVQQTLVDFGQGIAVDGSVGPKTIGALNAVQAAFGLEQTESLDAEGYAKLLPRLLFTVKPGEADALLSGTMDAGEYGYMQACALVGQGKFYSAKQAFEKCGWGDWPQRAADCVQEWPKTGQLYKNPEVKGSSTQLTVKVNGKDDDTAMLVKVYTTDDVLARTLFIGGSGKASCSLPAGTYVIKDGSGKNWYGEEEAFGPFPEGFYETMTFAGGVREVQLKKNYASTITMNVEEANPRADSVGSDWENWGTF